jgi:ribosome-associated protein
MIPITKDFAIGEDELSERFVLSSGPGGQNVNKVATTVQLRFDVAGSPTVPAEVKERLRRLAGRRIDKDGVLLIRARQHRSLERNRREARERLVALLQRAAERPKPRRARRGESTGARQRRLEWKHRHGRQKELRRNPASEG